MVWLRYWPMVAVLIGMYALSSAWIAILLYHAGILVAAWKRPGSWAQMGAGMKPGFLLAGIGVGCLSAPVVYGALPLLVGPDAGEQLARELARHGLQGGSLWIFAVYFFTVHPALEELGWRGLLRGKARWIGRLELEFAAYHLLVLHRMFPGEWGLLAISVLTLSGAARIWRALAVHCGGLAVPIGFHAVADAGILVGAFALAFSG